MQCLAAQSCFPILFPSLTLRELHGDGAVVILQ